MPKIDLILMGRPVAWRLLSVALVIYLLLLAGVLHKAKGIPYGLDGNETFSSAIHARNLSTFSLKASFGLTDESYATTEKGHPVVHSHQGNFPRLFNYVIYQLGARDIKSQILTTCLTVGVATLFLTFIFFNVTADGTLAFTICLVFLSDYLLFGQWFLNTYRIWHTFFFFSSLLCVVAFSRNNRSALGLTILNFFCLCYWEYVYATFVVILCVIYGMWYLRNDRVRVRRFLVSVFVGVLAAAGTLFGQLAGYAGWRNTLTDIAYTLHARNSIANEAFSQKVAAFYSKLNILFWPNYIDISKLRTWDGFRDSLFVHQLEYYSPWLAFLMVATALGWWLALIGWPKAERSGNAVRRPSASSEAKSKETEDLSLPGGHTQAVAMRSTVKWRSLSAKAELAWAGQKDNSSELSEAIDSFSHSVSALWKFSIRAAALSGCVLLAVLFAFAHRAGPISSGFSDIWEFFRGHSFVAYLSLILFIAAGSWLCFGSALRLGRLKWPKVVVAGVFVLFAGLWFRYAYFWFDWSHQLIWSRAGLPGGFMAYASYMASFAAIGFTIATGPRFLFTRDQLKSVRTVLTLTFCGLCAYSAVYLLFTGYIYSGYLERQAPFLVFLTDPLLGLVFYTLATLIFTLGKKFWLSEWRASGKRNIKDYRRALILAALVFGFGTVSMDWISLQNEFLKIVPINNYPFLDKLSSAPYRGKSFVVSTYAAPVAVQTHSWAYLEPVFFGAALRLTRSGFRYDRENTYKWFADIDSNGEYEKPDFAIVIRPTTWGESLNTYRGTMGDARMSLEESIGILTRAEQPFHQFLHNRISEVDADRERDAFAIIKLDWDYPAYLLPLPLKKQRIPQSIEQLTKFSWDIRVDSLPNSPGGGFLPPVVKSIATESQNSDEYNRSGPSRVAETDSNSVDSVVTPEGNDFITQAAVYGTDLGVTLETGPARGLADVEVNDWSGEVNLFSPIEGEKTFSFHADEVVGAYQGRTVPVPGQYVALSRHGAELSVEYAYKQQDRLPENLTSIDVVAREPSGPLHFVSSYVVIGGVRRVLININDFVRNNPDTLAEFTRVKSLGDTRSYFHWLSDYFQAHQGESTRTGCEVLDGPSDKTAESGSGTLSIPVPKTQYTKVFAIVRPGTATKSGPVYPSNAINLNGEADAYGTVRLIFKMPSGYHEHAEPLLSAGTDAAGSLLYLIYEGAHAVRLGFTDRKRIGLISPPIAIDTAGDHEVEVTDGSLYPEAAFAYENSFDPSYLAKARRQIYVSLDQHPVFTVQGEVAAVSPDSVLPGINSVGFRDCAPNFSGTIKSFSRLDPESDAAGKQPSTSVRNNFGPITLNVKFPLHRTGQNEPLLTTGVTGAGDFIYVTYLDQDHVRISYDHWGLKGAVGSPILIDYQKAHLIRIAMGSLFPQKDDSLFEGYSESEAHRFKGAVSVEVDGQTILNTVSDCYESPPEFVTIGENLIGGSTTGPSFSGSILSASRGTDPQSK